MQHVVRRKGTIERSYVRRSSDITYIILLSSVCCVPSSSAKSFREHLNVADVIVRRPRSSELKIPKLRIPISGVANFY